MPLPAEREPSEPHRCIGARPAEGRNPPCRCCLLRRTFETEPGRAALYARWIPCRQRRCPRLTRRIAMSGELVRRWTGRGRGVLLAGAGGLASARRMRRPRKKPAAAARLRRLRRADRRPTQDVLRKVDGLPRNPRARQPRGHQVADQARGNDRAVRRLQQGIRVHDEGALLERHAGGDHRLQGIRLRAEGRLAAARPSRARPASSTRPR